MTSSHTEGHSVETLVINSHPATRTTHEVVHQLSELLPIKSLDEFVDKARLSLAGEELRTQDFAAWLPPEMFPVHSQADLVKKVAAVVRVAGHILRREAPQNPSEAHLQLARELSGDEPQSGIGAFRGPSVFRPKESERR